jgi:hypothetical protein
VSCVVANIAVYKIINVRQKYREERYFFSSWIRATISGVKKKHYSKVVLNKTDRSSLWCIKMRSLHCSAFLYEMYLSSDNKIQVKLGVDFVIFFKK